MQTRLLVQLLVIFSVFQSAGCSLLKATDNSCNCAALQETQSTVVPLGKTTSQIYKIAQSFTLTDSKTVAKMYVALAAVGIPTDPLRLSIYANDVATDSPNLSAPVVTSIDTTVTATTTTWTNFCWSFDCTSSTVTLAASTKYWFVVYRNPENSSTHSAVNYFNISADGANSFDGAVKFLTQSQTTTWQTTDDHGSSYTGYDLSFKLGCDTTNANCN